MIRIRVRDDMPEGFQQAFEDALTGIKLRKVMAHAESIMKRRTARGEFLDGSSPGAESYSDEPYAQPAGSLTDRVREQLPDDQTSYFMTGDEDLWLVIEGGYEAVRRAKGLPTDTVDLMDTGQMLSAMRSAADRDSDGEIEMQVGYIDGASPQEAQQIARYHNVEGSGPNEVKRVFVGLTDKEADKVADNLKDEIKDAL